MYREQLERRRLIRNERQRERYHERRQRELQQERAEVNCPSLPDDEKMPAVVTEDRNISTPPPPRMSFMQMDRASSQDMIPYDFSDSERGADFTWSQQGDSEDGCSPALSMDFDMDSRPADAPAMMDTEAGASSQELTDSLLPALQIDEQVEDEADQCADRTPTTPTAVDSPATRPPTTPAAHQTPTTTSPTTTPRKKGPKPRPEQPPNEMATPNLRDRVDLIRERWNSLDEQEIMAGGQASRLRVSYQSPFFRDCFLMHLSFNKDGGSDGGAWHNPRTGCADHAGATVCHREIGLWVVMATVSICIHSQRSEALLTHCHSGHIKGVRRMLLSRRQMFVATTEG